MSSTAITSAAASSRPGSGSGFVALFFRYSKHPPWPGGDVPGIADHHPTGAPRRVALPEGSPFHCLHNPRRNPQ